MERQQLPPLPVSAPAAAPAWLDRPWRPRLAYRHVAGAGPTIVFLPGYMSDMAGGKATALFDWAATEGQACLLLDYAGCGLSDGLFADQTLLDWRGDVLDLIDAKAAGSVLIVGSSMGGWMMLLTALAPLMPMLFPAFAGDLFVLPGLKDGVLLVVLSLACTLLPFALSLVALKHLSAYGVQLVTNLEPVYAIVLAIVLLGEQRELTPLFYLGVGIILAAVFLHPLTQRPKRIEHPEVLGTSEAKNIVE